MRPLIISILAVVSSAALLAAQPTPPPTPPAPFAAFAPAAPPAPPAAPTPATAPVPPTPPMPVYKVRPEVFRGGYLGVSLISITPELRRHFGATSESGILISHVEDSSPAAKAGLRTGDVIVSIDGEKVDSALDLGRHLRDKRAGGQVKVEFVRDRAKQQATVTVTERERHQVEVWVPDAEAAAAWGAKAAIAGQDAARVGEEAARRATEYFNSDEWKLKMKALQKQSTDCDRLQDRLREVEARLRELERKLDK